ncbi:MAG: aminodeoxychorismate synthase component I [Paracoccaceae bacterium]
MTKKRVIFDEGPIAGGTVFAEPLQIIRADEPDDIERAFDEMENARANGRWLAGYVSYELGYCLSSKLRQLMPRSRSVPLILFGVFEGPEPQRKILAKHPVRFQPPVPTLSAAGYADRFAKLHRYICAGDIYQVNLTFALLATTDASPEDLYAALCDRQNVPHGALAELGGPVILSRSPELFFRVDQNRVIETRPMKGTAPRAQTAGEDDASRAWLATSEKNRAENLMIVDLLRNDISRVTEVGTVEVPELFRIETYATVHQMVSSIRGKLRKGITLPDILRALFPCGSVTGAPKIRAMQIISELESSPRGVYCGAIGWAAPEGQMSFNVAIRTLILQQDGMVTLNVGGGVIYDSTAQSEYDEALLKAKFSDLGG